MTVSNSQSYSRYLTVPVILIFSPESILLIVKVPPGISAVHESAPMPSAESSTSCNITGKYSVSPLSMKIAVSFTAAPLLSNTAMALVTGTVTDSALFLFASLYCFNTSSGILPRSLVNSSSSSAS